MDNVEKRRCIVCEREFEYNVSGKRISKRSKVTRRKNSLTCSKRCSRIYLRVFKYLNDKIRKEIREEQKSEDIYK